MTEAGLNLTGCDVLSPTMNPLAGAIVNPQNIHKVSLNSD
jgi:hypothetical protein